MKKVKLNIVVHGSKWLTFFTGMKRVKGKTDFTPWKERVKLNVVVHGRKCLTFFSGIKRVKVRPIFPLGRRGLNSTSSFMGVNG